MQQEGLPSHPAEITDVINDSLQMFGAARPGEKLQYFVLGLADAFWNIPPHRKERRYFAGKVDSKYYVYFKTAQGSGAAPLSWALIISLAVRCTQALFHIFGARLQIYVDDPVAALLGTPKKHRWLAAHIVLTWMILGFKLAFPKAQLAAEVDWIGIKIFASSERERSSSPSRSPSSRSSTIRATCSPRRTSSR